MLTTATRIALVCVISLAAVSAAPAAGAATAGGATEASAAKAKSAKKARTHGKKGRESAAKTAGSTGAQPASDTPAVTAAPLPRPATLGELPPPLTFAQVGEMRRRPRPPSPTKARERELKRLQGLVARTPTARDVVRWRHRLAELERDEAKYQAHLNNQARQKALAKQQRERRIFEIWRLRYEKRLARARRRKGRRMPEKPDLTPRVVVPPRVPINYIASIVHFETVVVNHPRYRRMDEILLAAGLLRLHYGHKHHNNPSIATGEQHLRQLLQDHGWSPLAGRAKIRLARLELFRGNDDEAQELLTSVAEHEKSPTLWGFARYRLAWMTAQTNVASALKQFDALLASKPDATIRGLAKQALAQLRPLLPSAPETNKPAGARNAEGPVAAQ
ncbi:MAG: tetratricopeptide repeat protein [Myxococcales bacterium]|nr:tetratricopeptide repeat protein [Myxococcales bacterium]